MDNLMISQDDYSMKVFTTQETENKITVLVTFSTLDNFMTAYSKG